MDPGAPQRTLNLEWRVVMRKSGFAAAAGLGSLALLLTACGGSSGSSGSSNPTATSAAQPGGQATSEALSNVPPPGSIVLHVQKSAIGWVLAVGKGQVVYAYDKDPKGGTPACTGSCAQIWVPVTGNPVVSPADKGLGTLGTVTTSNGAKQVTYNGSPLYTYKNAKPLLTNGNGVGGVWHVIKMSESNIVGGAG
jgi:predicted lipoprotein with Yx(FWY)xxD motif